MTGADPGCNECGGSYSPSYPCPIPQIADGDAVSAANANAPVSDLASRTEFLRCYLESLEAGTAHFVHDVTLHTDVSVGDVVYYDNNDAAFPSGVYKKAFIDIKGRDVYDNESCDTYTLDSSIEDSSYPFGIVVEAGIDNIVCISGQFKTSNYSGLIDNLLVDFSTLGTDSKIGQMYLTNNESEAGKVTKNKPPLGVPICFITPDADSSGNYLVHVRPVLHDLLLSHRHYSFKLTNQPATNLPVGYNNGGSNSAGDGGWTANETELDVYLYEYTDNGDSDNCPYTAGSTLTRVGTATYAGEHGTYGGMIHSFKGNHHYVRMVMEDAECIATGDPAVTSFEAFLNVWDRGGKATETGDGSGGSGISIFQGGGLTHMEANNLSPVYRNTNSATSTIEYKITTNVDLVNTSIPGWLQCDSTTCAGPGEKAKYYYNIDGDSVLGAVWPPYPVQSSVMYIDGVAPNSSQLVIDNEGIFWFDFTEDGAPFGHKFPDVSGPDGEIWDNSEIWDWNNNYSGEILPKEALFYYTILASKTDEAVVQSLTPKEGSMITITDENGEEAASGRLVVGAEFEVSEDSPVDGAFVVKDFDGFAINKGYVVEKITTGPLLSMTSTISGGQGVVTLSMADFGGVREGEPDMFFADDILLERHEDIFYKVFPGGRTSSLTGKVFVPTFLPTDSGETYSISLYAQILSPNSDGTTLASLESKYKVIDTTLNPTTGLYEGSTGSIASAPYTTDTISPGSFEFQYGYKVLKLTASTSPAVTPGDIFIFKLTRTSTSGTDKVGVLDVRYQISKSS